MISKEELYRHYNKKYSKSNYKEVKPVQVKGYPKDRFEAAVWWEGKEILFLKSVVDQAMYC